ncbi:response regulator [Flavitalea sp. BT771]|uniref:response regulator n=1 Tax=Flavitalea sp. BT771 TaxID=3063329 RepID=UPI0026E21E2A|nr:response regulator [Flavitalea sp. BT771]MDO6430545.1 response regulator [Flavitalea sp. BT771]MDV6219315.1 response regulator [Flavitalea sp. BT771]
MDQPLKILLIDDDSDDREIFSLVMKSIHPFSETDDAIDGYEALDKLKRDGYTPDLIFLDLNMPRMNGLECLREIRRIERLTRRPVIVLSTSSNPVDISASRAAGATDYIVKGNEIQTIKKHLAQVLQKYNPRSPTHE